jgi:predicted nucleic acid-binding protein
MTRWIDTNVFLRYLEKTDSAVNFMEKVRNGGEYYNVPSVVINEIAWVLESLYRLEKSQVIDYLTRLLAVNKFKIIYKGDWQSALNRWKLSSIKLTDWYIWSYMLDGDEIVSYDKHFDKMPGIKRIEPGDLY